MKTEDIDNTRPSMWVPMDDKVRLAALGKLAEECGELSAIIARCIIQGPNECDPETGILNSMALEKEMADVNGLLEVVMVTMPMNQQSIYLRAQKKYNMKMEWIQMLRDAGHGEA